MLDEKYFDEVITNLKNRLDRHDDLMGDIQEDIENLRMSETEIKVKLNSIEHSQVELKAMINDTNVRIDDNSVKQTEIIKGLIDSIKDEKKHNHKLKLQDRKELWAIGGATLSAFFARIIDVFIAK